VGWNPHSQGRSEACQLTRAWSGQPRPATRWTPRYTERGLPLKRKPLGGNHRFDEDGRMARSVSAVASICLLALGACAGRSGRSSLPRELPREVASAIYAAVRDAFETTSEGDPLYFDPTVVPYISPSDRHHPKWVVDVMLGGPRMTMLCTPDGQSRCNITTPGDALGVSALGFVTSSDTVVVRTTLGSVRPLQDQSAENWYDWGMSEDLFLTMKDGHWVVIYRHVRGIT
jgi:hypothetical protein